MAAEGGIVMEETIEKIRIDQLVHEYRDLGDAMKATESRRKSLAEQIMEWMGDEDTLEVEGLPGLRRKSRGTGESWDSDAVRAIIDKYPELWRKLIELGCVQISGKAVRDAIANHQLAGKPPGGIEGRTAEFLEWERK
ncbi:MAG TPA: hypothetical protein VF981_07415 [Gemmatimonadaceae bacterium]